MTDKEKFEAVVNYIKGAFNGSTVCCCLDFKGFNELLESLNK